MAGGTAESANRHSQTPSTKAPTKPVGQLVVAHKAGEVAASVPATASYFKIGTSVC